MIRRFLEFLRLVDPHDGLLSLTNIALIVVITKLIFVEHPTVFDLGTLLLALCNYNAKKMLAPSKDDLTSIVAEVKGDAAKIISTVTHSTTGAAT